MVLGRSSIFWLFLSLSSGIGGGQMEYQIKFDPILNQNRSIDIKICANNFRITVLRAARLLSNTISNWLEFNYKKERPEPCRYSEKEKQNIVVNYSLNIHKCVGDLSQIKFHNAMWEIQHFSFSTWNSSHHAPQLHRVVLIVTRFFFNFSSFNWIYICVLLKL